MPVIPALWEVEAGGALEARSLRLQRDHTTALQTGRQSKTLSLEQQRNYIQIDKMEDALEFKVKVLGLCIHWSFVIPTIYD